MEELTREQIELAKTNRNHLVISALDEYEDYFRKAMEATSSEDKFNGDKFGNELFVPFSHHIDDKVFDLTTTDIISIWSRALEIFPQEEHHSRVYPNILQLHLRYRLSTAIACTYGAMGINSDDWKELYKKQFVERIIKRGEYSHLLKLVIQSPEESAFFTGRVNKLGSRIEQIGDFDKKSHFQDKLLREIVENWRSAICILKMYS